MNNLQYFEEHPWDRACRLIRERELGAVHQVIVQCVCPPGTLKDTLSRWKTKIEALTGAEQEGDLLTAPHALSYIGTFGADTVVRIFLDDAAADVCENFELVTASSLLVWKPINTNQGHIYSTDGCCLECSQPYVKDLEVG